MHTVLIGNKTYYVKGNNTKSLKDTMKHFGIPYRNLYPTPVPNPKQFMKLYKIWDIKELSEYLKKE